MTPEERAKALCLLMGRNAYEDFLVVLHHARREAYEKAAKLAEEEAAKHKQEQHEHTGPHGEASEEAMMHCAAVWASEEIAAAIRRLYE